MKEEDVEWMLKQKLGFGSGVNVIDKSFKTGFMPVEIFVIELESLKFALAKR